MTDKRVIEYGVQVKFPTDVRVEEFGVSFSSQPKDVRVREYGIQIKMPADGNRPLYWVDGGTVHGAELWIKHGPVGGGTVTRIA